jgi:hypothetical protein
MTPRTRRFALAPIVVLAVLGVSGCTVVHDATQDVIQQGEKEFAFETTAEANDSADSYRFQGFLPEDGEDVRLLTDRATGEGAMTWKSSQAFDIPACEAGPVTGVPVVDPAWWPEDDLPAQGWQCMNWSIVEVDDAFYAWSTPSGDDADRGVQ